MRLPELMAHLDRLFQFARWAPLDGAASGLQVERSDGPIRRLAFAVDACQASIEAAGAAGAQALIVHHGLFWGREKPLTGAFYRRVRRLVELDIALIGIHLPLDAHPELGNNAGLADALGLIDRQPFGIYKGQVIGVQGRLPTPLPLDAIAAAVLGGGRPLGLLPHGKALNATVGLVSGGATDEVRQAITAGLDCYITGDASHEVVHEVREAGINVLFAGHYGSEVFGVRRLAARLRDDTGLDTCLIDLPTGF